LAGRLGGLGSASGLSAVDFIWQLRQKVSAQTRIALIANEFTAADFSALARLNLAAHLLWSDLSSETHAELLYALLHPRIRVFSEAISRAYLAQERADRAKPALPANVTDTERAMLNGLAASLSHEQIGMVAAISVRTAERCISDLKQKFGVESPFALGCEASRYGLIDETVWREFAKEMA
jgi:DNA-binding NarL/FixJ family response regulator